MYSVLGEAVTDMEIQRKRLHESGLKRAFVSSWILTTPLKRRLSLYQGFHCIYTVGFHCIYLYAVLYTLEPLMKGQLELYIYMYAY